MGSYKKIVEKMVEEANEWQGERWNLYEPKRSQYAQHLHNNVMFHGAQSLVGAPSLYSTEV